MSDNIQEAIRIARRSRQKRFVTGCLLADKKDRVISIGWSHKSLNRLNTLLSIHAEIHALLRAPRNQLLGATAYIATIAVKSGNLATSSKPCKVCAGALFAAGVSKAIFTTPNGVETIWLNEDSLDGLKEYHPYHECIGA